MKDHFKKPLALGLALAMLAGCSGGSGSQGGSSAETKNSIVVAINADLNTMDHHVATDGGSFIMQSLCIGGLAELDQDGQAKEDLAESWSMDDTGTVYTFKIREDAKWSDGTPITANDFVFAWRRLDDPELASEYAFILDTIHVKNAKAINDGDLPLEDLGVSAPDDKTFVVELDLPCGFLLGLMAFPSFFPLNEEFFKAHESTYAQTIDDLLYAGPYVFSNWEANAEYTFTKNPNYWNADAQADCVDEITFRFVSEAQSSALAYQQGDIDVCTLTGDLIDNYKDDPGFTSRLEGYGWRLNVNQANEEKKDLFGSVKFRQALSLATNRTQICDEVLKNGSVAAEGFIPKSFAYGPDGKDFRETAGNILEYDVDKAKTLIEEVKKELGIDEINVSLLYETDSEPPKKVCEVLQSQWAEIGVNVTLVPKTKKERLALMNALDYEIGLTRWGPDYADPQTFLDLFYSKSSGYNNYYFNDEYDALLTKAETGEDAADADARWADLVAAEKVIIDDMGLVPVFQNGSAMLINPAVTGVEFHSAGVDSYRHVKKS